MTMIVPFGGLDLNLQANFDEKFCGLGFKSRIRFNLLDQIFHLGLVDLSSQVLVLSQGSMMPFGLLPLEMSLAKYHSSGALSKGHFPIFHWN